MPRRDDDKDDYDDDGDREYPDAADTDAGDSTDDDTDLLERCPSCREMIFVDADRCPYCGEFVAPAADAAGHAKWVLLTAGACLLAVLYLMWTRGGF